MKNASFSLVNYRFPTVKIDLSGIENGNNEFKINIQPEGKFITSTNEFLLKFIFVANLNNQPEPAVIIDCEAIFRFAEDVVFGDIPDYFYPNSIAIIFPYVRAFVSTVSLQANYRPLVIPTMNLSDLSETLRQHVVVE